MRFILNRIIGVVIMVLLSLGSEALIALLRTNERLPDPCRHQPPPGASTHLPSEPEEMPPFPSFLQSPN
jgi:hypothetical protein